MTPFVAGLLAAVALAASPSGAARANDICVSGKFGVDRQSCLDAAPGRQALPSVTPTARFAPSQVALRAKNVTQRSSANSRAELLLALGPSRDDAATLVPSEAGAGEDSPQRIQNDAAKRSILMATLALAGIAGSIIFKLGGLRRMRRPRSRKRRGAIWAAADRARRSSQSYAGIDERPRQPAMLRDLDQAAPRKAGKRKAMPRQARRSPI